MLFFGGGFVEKVSKRSIGLFLGTNMTEVRLKLYSLLILLVQNCGAEEFASLVSEESACAAASHRIDSHFFSLLIKHRRD